MALDTIRQHPGVEPSLHDDIHEMKQHILKRYLSPWQRVDAGASVSFTHGLGTIPHVADVLEATDSQGTGEASVSSATITKNGTVVTVANTGTARFFRVRAF